MRHWPIVVVILLSTAARLQAQVFHITKVERNGPNLVLRYDLIDTLSRTYTVKVYSSVDNFISPLEKVSGDAGLEVKPGGNHSIMWNAEEELGTDFNGDVRLEVRGRVYIPFVNLDGFDDYRKFKRNSAYKITWTGGRGSSVLNFDLYRSDKKVASYPNIANVGYYSLRFKGVKPGKGYILKISDSKNKDEIVFSKPFQISRKVPLLLKAVPVAAVGYLAFTIISQSEEKDIIDPPLPGG